MAINPAKGHAALRRGCFSQPSTEYFLTICTEAKQAGLTTKHIADAILNEMKAMSGDGTWSLLCAIVMPDHVHFLAVLGERLSLGKTVQRLKAKTSAVLGAGGIAWERGFFDRQLRPKDDRLAVFQYIYLNPYRAGLVEVSDLWPHYYCETEEWKWFGELLELGRPSPEWLL